MYTVRQENKEILNSNLEIHWWNFGTKTLDFRGSAKNYLKKQGIKITTSYYKDVDSSYERCKVKVRFSLGNMNPIKIDFNNMEHAVRMCINIRLSYMGDKSKFVFRGRTRSINF